MLKLALKKTISTNWSGHFELWSYSSSILRLREKALNHQPEDWSEQLLLIECNHRTKKFVLYLTLAKVETMTYLKQLYVAIVFEYSASLTHTWNRAIISITGILKAAIKFIGYYNKSDLDLESVLLTIGWPSLQPRNFSNEMTQLTL